MYKKGDWVLFEFKVCQITDMEGGHVTGVSDGQFHTGSSSLDHKIRPLTLRNLRISQEYGYYYDWLHKNGSRSLNFPDIHRHMVKLWTDSCDIIEEDWETPAMCKDVYREVHNFIDDIKDQLKKNEDRSSHGVKLFK